MPPALEARPRDRSEQDEDREDWNAEVHDKGAGLAVAVCLAATAAHATDPVAKWCSGVKIAAFPGGPQGGVFANNVYNGFKSGGLDLGPTVTYYFSNWDPNTMLTQIKQALATKVDGIATYGFGGDDATDPLVNQAYHRAPSSRA